MEDSVLADVSIEMVNEIYNQVLSHINDAIDFEYVETTQAHRVDTEKEQLFSTPLLDDFKEEKPPKLEPQNTEMESELIGDNSSESYQEKEGFLVFSTELMNFGYQDTELMHEEEKPQGLTQHEPRATKVSTRKVKKVFFQGGAVEQLSQTLRQKSIEAKKRYTEITKELLLKKADTSQEVQRAMQEIKKLHLYTKEEELRRKKMLEFERKRAEAAAIEEAAVVRHQKEQESDQQRKKQQYLEFRLQKRAEDLKERRLRNMQIQQDNHTLANKLPKSSTYHMIEQQYKDSRLHRPYKGPSRRRQEWHKRMAIQKLPEKRAPKVYKGKAAELAREQEFLRRKAAKIQLETAKEKHFKASQYAALVREIFQPVVDLKKKHELAERAMKAKTPRLPPSNDKLSNNSVVEVKVIPPEARGHVVPKEGPVISKEKIAKKQKLLAGTTQIANTMSSTLQLGNIKLMKSSKQLDDEREAHTAIYQIRAKALLENISLQEQDMMTDPLAGLFNRFAKYSMVTAMYEDAISAKLNVLTST